MIYILFGIKKKTAHINNKKFSQAEKVAFPTKIRKTNRKNTLATQKNVRFPAIENQHF